MVYERGVQQVHRIRAREVLGTREDESTHVTFSVIKPKITSVSQLPV